MGRAAARTVEVGLTLAEGKADGEGLGPLVMLGCAVADGWPLGEAVALGFTDTEGAADGVAEADGRALGLFVIEGWAVGWAVTDG